MATKNTGKIYEDIIQNVVEVLKKNRGPLNLAEVHDTELGYIQKFPCVTVEFDSATEEPSEIGGGSNKYKTRIDVSLSITYYHEELTERTRRVDVRKQLNDIADVLRKNWDVNNYCTRWGSAINSVAAYVIVPPGEQWIAGGRIMMTCSKEATVTLV